MRVPTSDLHATNACWSLFLLSTYLVVAEAASFDKKELMQERYKYKHLESVNNVTSADDRNLLSDFRANKIATNSCVNIPACNIVSGIVLEQ